MARSAGKTLRNHVTLELDCFDRLHLNAQVPLPQTGTGTACFLREVRGNPAPSSALMTHMTRRFTGSLERFARERLQKGAPLGRRTDPVSRIHPSSRQTGVGSAQEIGTTARQTNLVNNTCAGCA